MNDAPPIEYATPLPPRKSKPLALLGIAACAVISGSLVGATTNMINGAVSPTYFVNVMGWDPSSNIWLASIIQGVLEGGVVGFIFSAILTISIGIITRATCPFGFGLRWLGFMMLIIYACWFVGGICGVLLAHFQPEFFQHTFIGVPSDHSEMLHYAWVGGSIFGAEPGGVLALILGLILFRQRWRRMLKSQADGTPWQ